GKATVGRTRATARAHVCSIDPRGASGDHSVWTWTSAWRRTSPQLRAVEQLTGRVGVTGVVPRSLRSGGAAPAEGAPRSWRGGGAEGHGPSMTARGTRCQWRAAPVSGWTGPE